MDQDTKTTQDEYVVLARRYRPARFDEVIGQEHVTRTLQNAIRAGRVHHAYLFTGSRGVGKTTVARILARALNHPDGPTPEPPVLDDPNNDPGLADVIEIDGASHTGVDNVRELRESVRYLPSQSRYKIYIIDEVHMLSTGAFNALLKTLEEPPPHVVFVFATTEPHKIPATILSRCQRFDFKRVPTDNLIKHMERLLTLEEIRVDPAGLALIARAAEGGVRDSLSLLDQVIAYAGAKTQDEISAAQVAEVLGVADRRVLFALSEAILTHDAAAALGVIDDLFRDGHDLSQVAQAFTTHLRDLVVVASCADAAPLVDATEAELKDLRTQAGHVELSLLQQHFDRFAHAAEEIARSTFPRLLFEMALIELVNAEPLLPLGDLLARLETLERRLSKTPTGGPPNDGGPKRRRSNPRREPLTFQAPTSRRGHRSAPEAAPEATPAAAPEATPAAAPASLQTKKPEAPSKPEAHTKAEAPSKPEAHTKATTSTTSAAPATSSRDDSDTPTRGLLADDATVARWRELLDKVGAPLATTFAAGHLISWRDGTIELGYAPEAFELTWAQDPKRRGSFAERCGELLGSPVLLDIRPLTENERRSPEFRRLSVIEARDEEERRRAMKLREEAESHPIARSLVEHFGAKILAVDIEDDVPIPLKQEPRINP